MMTMELVRPAVGGSALKFSASAKGLEAYLQEGVVAFAKRFGSKAMVKAIADYRRFNAPIAVRRNPAGCIPRDFMRVDTHVLMPDIYIKVSYEKGREDLLIVDVMPD